MLIPPNYDKLNSYEIIRFEEKFFSLTKAKINNEIKLYENWLLSILPLIIKTKYKNEILGINEKLFYKNWLKTSLPPVFENMRMPCEAIQFLNSLQNSYFLMD